MQYSITVNGRTVYSIAARYEHAWHIEDTPEVLIYMATQGNVIHGGDILDEQLNYTYSNWYYNDTAELTEFANIQKSLEVALDYIGKFIKLNGTKFYVVIVSKSFK